MVKISYPQAKSCYNVACNMDGGSGQNDMEILHLKSPEARANAITALMASGGGVFTIRS